MEVVSQPGYIEELPLQQLEPGQYMGLVKKAAAQLHWTLAGRNVNTLIYHSHEPGYPQRELISITVYKDKATLHTRPTNDYPQEAMATGDNRTLFKQAMAELIAEQQRTNRSLHPMHREKYGALIPSKSYLITPLIVYANAIVFIAMVVAGISPLHPTAQSLLQWGGNLRPAVAGGEWWRLITYMFLHGGAWHLLMNTYALLYIGMFLEPLMGKLRFTSTYVLTGICAGLMSIEIHPASVCIGASGAIFGMYGVFFSILTTRHIQKTMRKTMLRSILFFIVFNLMMGLQGNTDNAAHIGGLMSGLAIGYIYYPGMAKNASTRRQMVTTVILAIAVALLSVFSIYTLRR